MGLPTVCPFIGKLTHPVFRPFFLLRAKIAGVSCILAAHTTPPLQCMGCVLPSFLVFSSVTSLATSILGDFCRFCRGFGFTVIRLIPIVPCSLLFCWLGCSTSRSISSQASFSKNSGGVMLFAWSVQALKRSHVSTKIMDKMAKLTRMDQLWVQNRLSTPHSSRTLLCRSILFAAEK